MKHYRLKWPYSSEKLLGLFLARPDQNGNVVTESGFIIPADCVEEFTPDDELLRELAEALRELLTPAEFDLAQAEKIKHIAPGAVQTKIERLQQARAALAKYDQRRANP